ncbi:MAG: type II toxin-antitoxin system PemK/MazF family toxin [Dehalococcoidales bacterium]|nr:type II toxin-antitoxin system PemK/MazF family toxin [Dehalococcoidales bacterium]
MPEYKWAVYVAYLDPVTGSEQKGIRPVIIISNEEFNQAMPNVTVLPLTSTRRLLYPSEVLIPAGLIGQQRDSIIMAHQIRTISKQRLVELLGYLNDLNYQQEVLEAVKEHLDIW